MKTVEYSISDIRDFIERYGFDRPLLMNDIISRFSNAMSRHKISIYHPEIIRKPYWDKPAGYVLKFNVHESDEIKVRLMI